jgi:hypothetical protein
MKLVGSVFQGSSKAGDFGWMIERPEYADALFIFNDNEQQFYAHLRHAPASGQCTPGGGNAAIRPYQCRAPRRAAGIPTGSNGEGYDELSDHVRGVIDEALSTTVDLVATDQFNRIIYSAANTAGDLGTGIFSVAPVVRRYIVDGLRRVVAGAAR